MFIPMNKQKKRQRIVKENNNKKVDFIASVSKIINLRTVHISDLVFKV